MMSRISLEVRDAIFTLLRLPKSYATLQHKRTRSYRAAYGQNQVLHRKFDLDPFFIRKCRPNKVRFGDGVFVRVEDDFCLLIIDVKATEEKNHTRKRSVARDGLQPIICMIHFNIQITSIL